VPQVTQLHPQEIPPDYFFWENDNLTSIFERMNGTGIRILLAGLFLWVVQTTHPCLSQPRGSEAIAMQNLDVEAIFYDAAKAEMLENLEEAIRLYEKVLRIDAGNAAAYYKLASIQIRQNKITEALKNAKESVKHDKGIYYYWLQYAQLQEENRDWKGAVKSYRYLVEHFPDQQQFRLSVAQVLIKNGKFKDAVKELGKAEEFLGPSNELFQLRQRLLLQQNKVSDAIEDGRRWVATLPEEPESYFSFAQLLITHNQFEEGKKILLQMGEKFPSNPTSHLMLADIYINERKEDKAEEEMIKAFSSPDLPIGAKIDIVSGYLRGMDSEEEKKKAIAMCDLILKVHPTDARSYIIRGDILSRAGDKRGARDMFLQAKKLDKNNFGLWEQTVLIDLTLNEIDSLIIHTAEAKVLFPNTPSFPFYNGLGNMMKKQYPNAIESLEQARRISLDNNEMQFEIFSQLGDAYYNVNEKDKAWQAFDEALHLDSNSSHVLNNYSYFLSLEKTMLSKAAKMSSKLVRLFPGDPTFLDTYGWVLYQMGNYPEALVTMEKAVKGSESGVIWEHYGDVLFKMGRIEEAGKAWKKANDFGGEVSQELGKKLKELKLN
jgi:tetratricopeptide (TPR) repeat protein